MRFISIDDPSTTGGSSGGGSGSGAVTDGDKGDITVSGSGTVWTVDPLPSTKISDFAAATDARLPATMHGATTKATPADADELTVTDSAASFGLKKLTMLVVKAYVKAGLAVTDVTGAEATANKGAANGYAPLDSSSKVPAANLPSYVDDVLEFTNLAAFPATGSSGLIYVALDTGKIYRWGGSAYAEISASPGSTDAVPEGTTNLYYTAARVNALLAAGTAAAANKLATSRTIDGQSFDGTGNITVVAPATHAATSKAAPVDADELALVDSAASNGLKKLTWANLKAALWSAAGVLTNKSIDATTNTITNVAVANLAGSAVVTASETIAANNNDSTLPTSAAVKAALDAAVIAAGGGYTPGGTDVAIADGGTGASTAAAALSNLGAEATANKGAVNGYCPLDAGAKVPAANLPAYVDDVLEFANLAAFPATGTSGIIFVAQDTGKIYRWGASSYFEISPSPGSTDSVTEGSTNLYYTAARVDARLPVATHAATAKAAPDDADEFPLLDSTATFGLKKWTWSNIKAALGFANGADATKRAVLAVPAAQTTATTATHTLPSATSTLATTALAEVYTNKRITKRVGTGSTSAGALSINADSNDGFVATITAATTVTITGTPTSQQPLLLDFTAAAAYALTFATTGANQVLNSGVATKLAATVASKICRMGLIYDTTRAGWVVMSVDAVGY